MTVTVSEELRGGLVRCVSSCIDHGGDAWAAFRAQLRHDLPELSQTLAQSASSAATADAIVSAVQSRGEWPKFLRTFVAQFQSLAHDSKFLAILAAIASAELSAVITGISAGENNPYRHLRSFEREHAAIYHAPFLLPHDFIATVDKFFGLIGPPGCGKSSLARAYILPRIDPARSMHVVAVEALSGTFSQRMQGIFAALDAPPDLNHAHALAAAIHTYCAARPAITEVLLFFDQFEVLLEHATQTELDYLLDSIVAAVRDDACRVRVLLTMRSDADPRYKAHEKFQTLLGQASYRPEFLDFSSLRAAIRLPALSVGVPVEAELVDKLVNDLGGQLHMLPFLQVTLFRLFERAHRAATTAPGGMAMRAALYDPQSNLSSSIRRHVEDVLADPDVARLVSVHLPGLFAQLVDLDAPDRLPMRRRADLATIQRNPLYKPLAAQKLLISRALAGAESPQIVELAHDILLVAWQALADWIATRREHLATRARLDRGRRLWLAESKARARLLTRGDLRDARRLPPEFTTDPALNQYIAASARARSWDAFWLIAGAAALIGAIVVAFVLSSRYGDSRAAEALARKRQAAETRSYAALGHIQRNEPHLGLHHAMILRANSDADPVMLATAKQVLLDGLATVADQEILYRERDSPPNFIKISPDGDHILFGNTGAIFSYDVTSKETKNLSVAAPRRRGQLRALDISADGQRILAVHGEGVFLVDRGGSRPQWVASSSNHWAGNFAPHSSEEIMTISMCDSAVSPASTDTLCASIWDLDELPAPREILEVPASCAKIRRTDPHHGGEGTASCTAYSAFGQRLLLVTANPSGSHQQLRSASLTVDETLFETEHSDLHFLASPDGEQVLLKIGMDRSDPPEWHLYLLSLEDPGAPSAIELSGYNRIARDDNEPTAYTFSPDGTRIFVGFARGQVLTWMVDLPDTPFPLPAHELEVMAIAVPEARQSAYTASLDAQIHRLDLRTGSFAQFAGHDGKIAEFAVAPNEEYFVSLNKLRDPSIRRWTGAETIMPIKVTPDRLEQSIQSLAISANGDQIALGTRDEIRLVNPRDAANVRTIAVDHVPEQLKYAINSQEWIGFDRIKGLRRLSAPHEPAIDLHAALGLEVHENSPLVLDAMLDGAQVEVFLADGRWLRGTTRGARFTLTAEIDVSIDSAGQRQHLPFYQTAAIYPACDGAILSGGGLEASYHFRRRTTPGRRELEGEVVVLSGDCQTAFKTTNDGIVVRPVAALSQGSSGKDAWQLTLKNPPNERITKFAVSHDGLHVVAATDAGVYYWDLRMEVLVDLACNVAGEPSDDTKQGAGLAITTPLCPRP